MSDYDVEIVNVSKRFGQTVAVDDLTLRLESGQFLTLLGPSGCGKTTTLRMIGGFEHPDSGQIAIRGELMGHRPPHQRDSSMVFQNYALFPHMSVAKNIGYGLRERKIDKRTIDRRVDELLALVDLPGYGNRRPRQLSGGQQQRVALARSLIIEPSVLLLDEPLGALDLKLRRQMQLELKRIQEQVGISFIYVTHDQEEALAMSDRIAVMNQGRVEQYGTAVEIFERPATRFVASFMGAENILDAQVLHLDAESVLLDAGGTTVRLPLSDLRLHIGDQVALMIRPEKLRLVPDSAAGTWTATICHRVYKGAFTAYRLRLPDGSELTADVLHDNDTLYESGQPIGIRFNPHDGVVIRDM